MKIVKRLGFFFLKRIQVVVRVGGLHGLGVRGPRIRDADFVGRRVLDMLQRAASNQRRSLHRGGLRPRDPHDRREDGRSRYVAYNWRETRSDVGRFTR